MIELAQHLTLHHLGLASRDPAVSRRSVEALGYRVDRALADPLQRVDLLWCLREGAPPIEIVSAMDEESPLKPVLARQREAALYHLCYELSLPLDETLAALRAAGSTMTTVREPMPAVLFGGRRVSFYFMRGIGLVELLEP